MKESLLTDVFFQAGLFLLLAAIIIPILRYAKIPTALGYLLAGIALGPYGFGIMIEHFPVLEQVSIKDDQTLTILAEIGIVLLLFVIGLELTPRKLWQMRNLVFGLGGAQVIITALVVGGTVFAWGNSMQVSVLLGLGLALSSTALVIQWLQEQKLFASQAGRSSFSILLFQDLFIIPILLLLTILSSDLGENVVQFVSFSLFKMVATVLVIYFAGKILLKPLFLFANKHGGSEVFMALSLLVIVVCSYIASLAGISMALGAFMAGLLLADTQYRHEISALIIPFKSMLLGFFFLSFGMGINLAFIMQQPLWLGVTVIGLMLVKAVIVFILCKIWKQTTAVSAESAILLSQAGEFGLLVVGSGLALGLMEEATGQFTLITIGISMLLTPLITPISRRVGHFLENKDHAKKNYHASQADNLNKHIVIFGFGQIGQGVADVLCREGYEILGFDKNIELVNKARSGSRLVYLGDAVMPSTLKAAQLEKALCATITLDDEAATRSIIKSIRRISSTIPIVVRTHNSEDMEMFDLDEHTDVIAEHLLISGMLSEKILSHCASSS
jgi:monovalent cation:H+ antiporter-2, CPA2 family